MNNILVELRGLEARDINSVLSIQSAAPEAAQWKREAYEAILNGGPERLIVAEHITALVGFASYRVIAPECELLNLAVLPAFRRQGIGARLLQEVIRAARNCGVSDFFLEVRDGNRAALRLYEHFGFQITSRRSHYYREPLADALTLHYSIGGNEESSPHSPGVKSNEHEKYPH
jgi:[ribosomal protein S18]-alanine N-acetyltransferase